MVRSGVSLILTGMTTRAFVAVSAASVALLAMLAGCGGSGSDQASEIGTIRTEPMPAPEPELPPVQPVTAEDCPYLSTAEASSLGGAPVTTVRIDESLDPAACFFYDVDGAVALTTTVYTVDSADRASELVAESAGTGGGAGAQVTAEGGWTGGSTEAPGGSLVVLSRDERILAVQTASDTSESAQQVAELVGPRLG